MADTWPEWSSNASRGDVIRLAVRQRTINIHLYQALGAALRGEKSEAYAKLKMAMEEDENLNRLIDQLGEEK